MVPCTSAYVYVYFYVDVFNSIHVLHTLLPVYSHYYAYTYIIHSYIHLHLVNIYTYITLYYAYTYMHLYIPTYHTYPIVN